MSDISELTTSRTGPECSAGINITKQSGGYVHERTVTVRRDNQTETSFGGAKFLVETPTIGGEDTTAGRASRVLGELLRLADTAARDEIARCEQEDAVAS